MDSIETPDRLYPVTFLAHRSLIDQMDEYLRQMPAAIMPNGRSRRITRSEWLREAVTKMVQE